MLKQVVSSIRHGVTYRFGNKLPDFMVIADLKENKYFVRYLADKTANVFL